MITSLQNPKVKEACHLYQRRDRDKMGRFLIEGYRELSRAVEEKLLFLFYCPSLFLGSNEEALIEKFDCPCYETDEKVFRKLSYRDRPDGLLAVAQQVPRVLADQRGGDFFVVAEAIEKPGNLGTMLRSSDASGVDAFMVSDPTTDIYNPNVVRASVGTLFTQPVYQTTNEETFSWLEESEVAIVAATPQAKMLYTEADFTKKVAIVVGTEQLGLSSFWMERAAIHVQIPMLGVADSLNVATAATLLMYEVVRQRGLCSFT